MLGIIFNISLKAMENSSIQPESKIEKSQKAEAIPKRKCSKRSKKKKQKAVAKKMVTENLAVENSTVNSKTPYDFVDNQGLEAVLKFNMSDTIEAKKEYIQKLNFLANILLLQEWMVKHFKDAHLLLYYLIKEAHALNNILCISPTEDGIGICGHNKDEFGKETTRILQDPLAIQLAKKVLAPLLLLPECDVYQDWKSSYDIVNNPENYSPDMIAVSRCIIIYSSFVIVRMKFKKIMMAMFKFIPELLPENIKGTIKNIANGYTSDALEIFPRKKTFQGLYTAMNLNEAQKELISHFLPFCKNIKTVYVLLITHTGPVTFKKFSSIYTTIKNTIDSLNPSFPEDYNCIYKKIIAEQTRALESIPLIPRKQNNLEYLANKVFLSSDIKQKKLPEALIEDKKQDQQQHNYIEDFTETANACLKQPSKTKKKKRHRRGHRKASPEEPVQEENMSIIEEQKKEQVHIKFPCYADRVINRFNQSSNNNDLYHTFSPIADAFIIKYGTSKHRQNQTFDDQMDTKFSLLGKVELKDGTTIFGKFGITLGIDKICYHRQFKCSGEKENPDVANIKFDADFPSLISEDIHYTNARLLFDAQNDEIYGEKRFSESSECIVIEDARNEVIITLFKTQNNNTIH